MSISSTTNRVTYTGNGAVDTYSYTFRIFSQSDLLVVVKNTSTSAETTLTITTDYTVTGVGDAAGGTIILVNASQAWLDGDGDLDTGWTITIRRKVSIIQATDIRNQGDFYPEVHEDAFDYSRMIDQQQQDELDRSVKNPEAVLTSTFDPTLPVDIATASIALVTNSSGDGFEVGPTTTEISNAQTYATNASASATLSESWATKVDGQVASTDYSSKAWAIGGTGVTDTASRGAAKEWATETASTVDGTEYSAKEYAQGTQIRGASGSSKDWAQYTGGVVDASEYSSKAYALGGTGITDTSGKGAAKEWATKTTSTVDTSEYSAKEYAQGTQAGTGGSAKDWAIETASDVDGVDYSSKEYAIGTQTRGASGGGSAKDWATYTSSTVDDTEFSAKYYAQQAAAAVNSAFFRDVIYITSADSPVTVSSTENGKLYSIDSSGGAITINLPTIAGVTMPFNVAFSLGTAGNTVTINRGGTDTIDGGTSTALDAAGTGIQLAADTDGTPDNWTSLPFGIVADGAITTAKLADDAVTRDKLATGGIGKEAVVSKTAAYTATDADDVILCDASSAAFTITLPTAVGISGKYFFIKKTDSDYTKAVTIDGNGSETIDGSTTTTLNTQGETLKIVSDGSNWFVVDRYIPSVTTLYSLTITGSSSNPSKATSPSLDEAYWSRDGDCAIIQYTYTHSSSTGTAIGSGTYQFSLPSGLTADSGKIGDNGNANCGSCFVFATASNSLTGTAMVSTAGNVITLVAGDDTVQDQSVGSANASINQANITYSFTARIPITGWNG